MNKTMHRLFVILFFLALTAGITLGGFFFLRRNSIKTVKVTRVENIVEEDYYDESNVSMSGSVVSNVSQQISLSSGSSSSDTSSDITVDQVFVSEGDQVKVGDPIISFDTTIAEMKLNIERMKLELAQLRLNNVYAKLDALKSGASLADVNKIGEEEMETTVSGLDDADDNAAEDMDDLASLPLSSRMLKAIKQPFLILGYEAASFLDATVGEEGEAAEESSEESSEEGSEEDGGSDDTSDEEDPIFDDGENFFHDGDEDNDIYFDPSDGTANYPVMSESTDFTDGSTEPYGDLSGDNGNGLYPWMSVSFSGQAAFGVDNLEGGDEDPFYRTLSENTLPFTGQGTPENPYVYLCTCAKGRVTVTGGFLNVMAGYNAAGSIKEREGFWYQLEWHRYDTITDYSNRRESCTGYYLINGNLLQRGVDISARTDFELDSASTYPEEEEEEEEEEDEPQDEESDDLPDEVDEEDPAVREELIKSFEQQAKKQVLNIRKQEIALEKQEKLVSKKLITAKIDGVVSHVGDVSKGGTNVITIKSNEGYYVKGQVSELNLSSFPLGTQLSCTDWMTGLVFNATVTEVSEYPVSNSNTYYDGNGNASQYTFTASINDQDSLDMKESSWLDIQMIEDESEKDKLLVIDRAFIRSENGSHYVYKDSNGFLKKHYIKVDSFVNSGYYAKVSAGLKRSDLVAFPYGSGLKEGLPTVEVGYYDIVEDTGE